MSSAQHGAGVGRSTLTSWRIRFDFRIGDRNHKQAKEYICTVRGRDRSGSALPHRR